MCSRWEPTDSEYLEIWMTFTFVAPQVEFTGDALSVMTQATSHLIGWNRYLYAAWLFRFQVLFGRMMWRPLRHYEALGI